MCSTGSLCIMVAGEVRENIWAEPPCVACLGGDEVDKQLASSPPPSWEDRAELMPEEQPFGVSWMETGMRHPWPTHCVHTGSSSFTVLVMVEAGDASILEVLCR